jgi:hypothetical protein
MSVRDLVLLYLLFTVGGDLVRELRATQQREREVDLTPSARTGSEGTIDLAMAGSDTPTAGLDDDIDPRLSSDA